MRCRFVVLLAVATVLWLGNTPAVAAPALPAPPDSLRRVLAAAPAAGPGRIEALLRVASAYFSTNDPRTVAYCQAARAEAIRLHQPADEGRALDLLGQYTYETEGPARALPLLRQAEKLLASATPGARAQNLYHLAQSLNEDEQLGLARRYYRRAYALAALAPADSLILRAEILNSLGILMVNQDQPDSAVYYLYRALPLQRRRHLPDAEAATLMNLAGAFYTRDQFGLAARYGRAALRVQLTGADTLGVPSILHMLSTIVEKYPDSLALALRYERQATPLWRRYHDLPNLALNQITLGSLYQRLHRPDSAEAATRRALRLYEQLGLRSSNHRGYALVNLANIIGLQPGRETEARPLATEALALAVHDNSLREQQRAVEVLRALAVARRDYPTAYALAIREARLTDTLVARQNHALTERLRLQYENGQTALQLERLTRQQAVSQLRQQQMLIGAGALVLALLGLGTWGWLAARRRRQRREAALRTRIAADLHDDVGSILTQISLETEMLREGLYTPAEQPQQLHRLADASRTAVRHMNDVVWGLDARHDSMPDLLDRLRDHAHEVLPPKGIDVEFAATPEVEACALPLPARQALYLIYKEALHNVVKHAAGATLVRVRLAVEGRALVLALRDNGQADATVAVGRNGNGHGQGNMAQRATSVGGALHSGPADGGGFEVVARVPVG